jgi:L-lactate dehydrogenase (cytochrome)
LGNILALNDFERAAQKKLPRPLFGYIAGSAESGKSHRDNVSSFERWSFVPRVLENVSGRSQQASLFSRSWSSPFGIAPMGIAALSTYRGDLVLATSAAQANIPYILSGVSLTPLETVMAAAPDSWFQVYLPGDQQRIDALVARCQRAGVRTLVVTVDIPVPGNRENNVRAGFSMPLRPGLRLAWDGITRPSWLFNTFLRTLKDGVPHFENAYAERGAPVISASAVRDFSNRDHLSWEHIARIRESWKGTLVLKGILSVHDAARADRLGVDGVILSNHGGRQLDGTVAPLNVLPDIVAALPGLPVMIDGGFRRGSDVLKALGLGARFVFIGRPFNFAAAVGGSAGVAHAIGLLRAEIDRNLAMLGVTCIGDLSPDFLTRSA